MTLSDRDKIMGLLLPTLLVVAGYAVFFFSPRQKDLNRAQTALDEARLKAPGLQNQLMQAQAKIMRLAQDQKRADTDLEHARNMWASTVGSCSDPRQRNHRVERLNDILRRRNLH